MTVCGVAEQVVWRVRDDRLADRLSGRLALRQAYTDFRQRRPALPAHSAIAHHPDGRPYLPAQPGLFCSISHSQRFGVAAVALAPVGIDIETIRPRDPRLLDYVADKTEAAALRDLVGSAAELLTLIWTLKEATAKASGLGLGLALRRLRVRATGTHSFEIDGWRAFSYRYEHFVLERFRYPVAKLADRLQLPHANAMALSQQGCSGLLSTINIAARMVQAGDPAAALCVAGDALPKNANREIMYNVMSDAAAAVVVERGSPRNQIVSFHQLGQPAYWDSPQQERELIAAYFPMAQRAICGAIEQAGLRLSDIRWIVPSNVSLRSWTILADLLRIPAARIWSKNIARVGHTVSCDHVINLRDMSRDGALSRGDHLLLFTFGFGASWTSLILQH